MPKEKSFHTAEYRRFARKLKDARAELKLTQRQVAEKLGRPHTYVAKIESGERRVDVVELRTLAKVYKKPIEFFLNA